MLLCAGRSELPKHCGRKSTMTVMGEKLAKEVKVLRACGTKKKDPNGFHFWFTKANEEFFSTCLYVPGCSETVAVRI